MLCDNMIGLLGKGCLAYMLKDTTRLVYVQHAKQNGEGL
jgi:hypothetical protein